VGLSYTGEAYSAASEWISQQQAQLQGPAVDSTADSKKTE